MNPKLLALLALMTAHVSIFGQNSIDSKSSKESESEIVEITVYPNTIMDELQVELDKKDECAELSIVALNGNVILEKSITSGEQIDLSGLNNGHYFLHLNDGNINYSKKLIVQK